MIIYVLIGLSLVLTGIVGLQFTYLFYIDWLDRHRKNYIRSLEIECSSLSDQLSKANARIAAQKKPLTAVGIDSENDDEVWADVIEDR